MKGTNSYSPDDSVLCLNSDKGVFLSNDDITVNDILIFKAVAPIVMRGA